MNKAGIISGPNPIIIGALGAKAGPGKQADLHAKSRDFSDNRQLISFQHYSKSAKAEDEEEGLSQDQQDDATGLPAGQAAIFDSLFVQMEKKILSQNPAPLVGAAGKADLQGTSQATSSPSGAIQNAGVTGAKVLPFPQNQVRRVVELEKTDVSLPQQAITSWDSTTPPTKTSTEVKVVDPSGGAAIVLSGLPVDKQGASPEIGTTTNTSGQSSHASNQFAGLVITTSERHFASDRDTRDDPDQASQDRGKGASASAVPIAPFVATPIEAPKTPQAGSQSTAPSLVDQISQALKSDALVSDPNPLREGDRKTLTLRLNPDGLGRVSIRLEKKDGMLKVSFSAEHESTSESLKAGSPELARVLESSIPGFSANDMSFSTTPQHESEARQDFKQNATNSGAAGSEQGREQSSGQPQVAGPRQGSSISSLGETANESRTPGRRAGLHDGGVLYL